MSNETDAVQQPNLSGLSLNLEGIAQLRDGRLVAVVDNQGATVEGPNELLVFEPGVALK